MRFSLNKNGIAVYEYTLNNRLNQAKKILADDIFNNLELFSPVRTGKLKNSYLMSTEGNVISIGNNCGYCQYVNNGTVYQSGQHFIERSLIAALATFERKENNLMNK